MRCMKTLVAIPLLICAAAAQARLVEEQLDVPVQVRDAYGKTVDRAIRVTVFFDDATTAPHPIIVVNHGRAAEAAERAALGRARYGDISRWLAVQGFLVAVPTRIGYGVTGGDDVEDSGACTRKNYPPGYLAAARQTEAVLTAMAARADTVKNRSVVLGQSYGGATSVAVAALNPPGVVASINFAGGGGGNPKTQPQAPCAPKALEHMFSEFGSSAKVPMLWVYTENDQYFGASLPKGWVKAFQDSGGMAEFVQFGPHGDDGHSLFTRFPAVWQPAVVAFLRKQGFTMKDTP
jgi:dienelactone hydrolase